MAKSTHTVVGQFNAVASGAVRYFALNSVAGQIGSGHDTNDPSNPSGESKSKAYGFACNGKIKSLEVCLTYPVGTGTGNAVATIMQNGNPTPSAVTLEDGMTGAKDYSDVAINNDDLFAVKVDNGSSDAVEGFWKIEVEEG